jgi:hypothetical protein
MAFTREQIRDSIERWGDAHRQASSAITQTPTLKAVPRPVTSLGPRLRG